MRAGQVAQPVAQRDQSAQRPHVRRRQGDQRVGRAQCRRGHVEHQVVRADRDDRALDVGQPAQQLHPDPLAGVVTLHPGRHHQEAVRADQRGQHAGRARQGCRHDVAADAAQPDPDPVVGADGRGQLAGQPGGGRRPLPRGRTLERGQHRRGEDVEGQRGRDRVAGGAQYRSSGHRGGRIAGDDAQHDRVPGTHGDAVHGQRAGGRDHARGVVVASGARPGDEDHQVGVDGGRPDRGGDQLGVVDDDGGRPGLAADLGGLRGQHHRVGVGDLAGEQVGADRADLVAGRDDHHPGPAAHRQLDHSGGGAGGHVERSQPVALGEEQLGGADVLADRADVLVGRHGGTQLGAPVRGVVHVLAHDDGVVAGRQRVAGVDHREVVQQHRCGLGGTDRRGGPHGDAVHRRGVERG